MRGRHSKTCVEGARREPALIRRKLTFRLGGKQEMKSGLFPEFIAFAASSIGFPIFSSSLAETTLANATRDDRRLGRTVARPRTRYSGGETRASLASGKDYRNNG